MIICKCRGEVKVYIMHCLVYMVMVWVKQTVGLTFNFEFKNFASLINYSSIKNNGTK